MSHKVLSIRLLLIALVLLQSGCAVKFIYNQLDWLIPWYLDDYVSLDAQQEVLLEQRLQHYLDWHRKQQLPVYADFLQWIAQSSEDGLTLAELDHIQIQSEKFSAELFARLAPALQDLFSSLDDQQVTELFNNFAEENKDYFEQYVETGEKKQRQKRAKDIRKFIQRWTGHLNDEQVKRIEQWSRQYLLMGKDFLQSRQAWQQQLQQILLRRKEPVYFEQALENLFANRRLGRTEEYKKKFKINEIHMKQLYLDLDATLTGEQRSRMMRKLKAYAEDFMELSKQ